MKVIIINGPMGVGKTTVGRLIADKVRGTAFIDGDWCFDIHPFVGSRETKAMAVDNILHMIGNYSGCSACGMVVLSWLMDDEWVRRSISDGISALGLEYGSVTLTCGRAELISRWKNDGECEWRTDEWLGSSVRSLPYFSSLDDALDTSSMSAEQAAEAIMQSLL